MTTAEAGPCLFCGAYVTDQSKASGYQCGPDWATEDGDFGCDKSPETCEEGCGSHARTEEEAERARTSEEARTAAAMNAAKVRPEGLDEGRIERALASLVRWATHGDRTGNPYCKPEVREAIRALGGDGYELPPYFIQTIEAR